MGTCALVLKVMAQAFAELGDVNVAHEHEKCSKYGHIPAHTLYSTKAAAAKLYVDRNLDCSATIRRAAVQLVESCE